MQFDQIMVRYFYFAEFLHVNLAGMVNSYNLAVFSAPKTGL
jgi:hypothetical protein